MECSRCHEPTESGALFCGNCGQPLTDAAPPSAPVATNQVPSYAVALPAQHAGETQTLLAALVGITGVVGAMFMPLAGLLLGGAGLVLGTIYRRNTHQRQLNAVGLFFSVAALVAALATWTYAYNQDVQAKQQASTPVANGATASLTTPCYSLSFIDRLNVSNESDSCDWSAFNGTTLDNSTNAYKVYASRAANMTAGNFTSIAKEALEKDLKASLPTFTIASQRVAGFAGSPAYSIVAVDKTRNVSVIETAVYHPVGNGQNIFILVHAVNGDKADLQVLEAQWQWK